MNLGLAVALAATVVLAATGYPRPRLPLAAWLLAAFTLSGLVSATVGVDPWCGFRQPWDLVTAKLAGQTIPLWCGLRGELDLARATLTFWLVVLLLRSHALRQAWLVLVVAAAGMLTVAGLVDYALGRRTGGRFLRDPAVGHSNHTASFLVISLPVMMLATRLHAIGRPARVLARGATGLGVVALILTQSLTGWIAGAVACSVPVARLRSRRLLLGLLLAPVAAAIVFAPTWTKVNLAWVHDSVSVRFQLWEQAVAVIAANPLFGIGPRGFISVDTSAIGEAARFHAHNLYLNIAAELGLVGLGLFLATLTTVAWHLGATRRLIRDDMDAVCWYGAAAALAALLVLGLATTPYHSRIAMMFWAIVGLFYAQFADRGRPAPS